MNTDNTDKIYDNIIWEGKIKDFECFIRKVPESNLLCGYIKLPKNHPDYDNYFSRGTVDKFVHGGITCQEGDGVYGFDSCHPSLGDYNHYGAQRCKNPKKWTVDDVKKELERLVKFFDDRKDKDIKINKNNNKKIFDQLAECLKKNGLKINNIPEPSVKQIRALIEILTSTI